MKLFKKGSGMQLDFVDLGALGVGSILGGLTTKLSGKLVPNMPADKIGPATSIVVGFLLTKVKMRELQFAGLGFFSKGFADAANAIGIGDEALSDAMDLNSDMEAELAAELAAEMEAEMEAELAEEVQDDGSY